MTDKEKVIALLVELGVGFEIYEDARFGGVERIDCEAGMPRVGGYDGHSFSWYFDEKGNFTQVNAWA